jgi:DNA-binding protein HU-beta
MKGEHDMNKSELIEAAADRADLSKGEMTKALDALIATITDAVRRDDKVAITGFGSFERRARAARTARNPQTGAEVHVPASNTPAFKAGKAFKDAVN